MRNRNPEEETFLITQHVYVPRCFHTVMSGYGRATRCRCAVSCHQARSRRTARRIGGGGRAISDHALSKSRWLWCTIRFAMVGNWFRR